MLIGSKEAGPVVGPLSLWLHTLGRRHDSHPLDDEYASELLGVSRRTLRRHWPRLEAWWEPRPAGRWVGTERWPEPPADRNPWWLRLREDIALRLVGLAREVDSKAAWSTFRLACHLLPRIRGAAHRGGSKVNIPLRSLANTLGMSPSAVSRGVGELLRLGIVIEGRRRRWRRLLPVGPLAEPDKSDAGRDSSGARADRNDARADETEPAADTTQAQADRSDAPPYGRDRNKIGGRQQDACADAPSPSAGDDGTIRQLRDAVRSIPLLNDSPSGSIEKLVHALAKTQIAPDDVPGIVERERPQLESPDVRSPAGLLAHLLREGKAGKSRPSARRRLGAASVGAHEAFEQCAPPDERKQRPRRAGALAADATDTSSETDRRRDAANAIADRLEEHLRSLSGYEGEAQFRDRCEEANRLLDEFQEAVQRLPPSMISEEDWQSEVEYFQIRVAELEKANMEPEDHLTRVAVALGGDECGALEPVGAARARRAR